MYLVVERGLVMRNPYCKPNRALGITDVNWQAAVDTAKAWLQDHPEVEEVSDTAMRALWAPLTNDRLWNQFRKEVGG